MTKRLHNWTYRDVTDFLSENGFRFLEEIGDSHQAWSKVAEEDDEETMIRFNFTHEGYPIGTLKHIIRQSRIPEETWIEWANS